jgi:hypothetical protein
MWKAFATPTHAISPSLTLARSTDSDLMQLLPTDQSSEYSIPSAL